MNTKSKTINTHRAYEASLLMQDGTTQTMKVCANILDFEAKGIGTKSFCREQIKRTVRGVRTVKMGTGHEVVGAPAGFTEFNTHGRTVATNRRNKENWLNGFSAFIGAKVAERENA